MSLQTIIVNSPLDTDQKAELIGLLAAEGATPDVVATIKAALQEYIDNGFQQLGVQIDPNDPEIQAAQADFESGIAEAEAEYNEEMENLSIDAAVAQSQGNKALDTIQAGALRAQLAA